MPSIPAVYDWLAAHQDFAERYARAKSDRVDELVEQTLEIADNLDEDPNSRRIRIDARKWFASKMRPDKYGDHLAIDQRGESKLEIVIRSVLDPAPAAVSAAVRKQIAGSNES